MHGSTKDRLEQLLARGMEQSSTSVERHLDVCRSCSSRVETMRDQAALIRLLRSPEEADPAPGFYARVLQKIEERAKRSIWYGLAYSRMGQRIAYGSLSLALGLGIYIAVVEQAERNESALQAIVAPSARPEVFAVSNPAEQRDAVLVNFASYSQSDDVVAQ